MLAFLCGAMEYAEDGGRGWRRTLGEWLRLNLKHQVYDPTQEALRLLTREERDHLNEWKRTDLTRFRKIMRRVINRDLDVMVHRADYVICFWDEAAARGCGTQAELTAAYRKGLPVFLVTRYSVPELSGWLLGCVDRVFDGFDRLQEHLRITYGGAPRQEQFREGVETGRNF